MKSIKKILLCAAASGFFASSLSAQEWVFEDVTVPVGATTASVNWTYTGGGGSSQNSVDIPASVGILTGVDLSNCIISDGADTSSCLDNAGTIRITMLNFNAANELGDAAGTLVFDVDPAAIDGDSENVVATAVPGGFDVTPTITNGSVSVAAGPPAVLDVSPPNINFGNVIIPGPSAEQPITITNAGDPGAPDLTVNSITVAPAQFAEGAGSTCGATPFDLAVGASCNFHVVFTPDAEAAFNGTVDIVSSAGNDTVTLEGVGTTGPSPSLDVNPAVAAFGTVDLGNMPQSIVHTVTNNGDPGSTLELTSIVYAGDAQFSITDTCPATLAQNESCTITVTFDAAANGNFTGSVDVTTNAGNASVPVTGEADSVANLVINPPFGPVDLGLGAPGDVVSANGSVENTGSASGDFSCVLGGPDAAVFSTTPDPLVGPVAAGATADFTLSCAIPTGAGEGDVFNATLTCSGDLVGTHDLSCGASLVPVIPVPTMQPWALALFALMMLIVGGFSIRFFRVS